MKSAIILAAGMGQRLKEVWDLPKGLLAFSGETLIQRSLRLLGSRGIQKIVVVTGYQGDQYESMELSSDLQLTFVRNEDFENTGSMHSLYLASSEIEEDCLLLESDLLYEAAALDSILACNEIDAILLSNLTGHGDEVYAYDKNNYLLELTKTRKSSGIPHGELVGISKISQPLLRNLTKVYCDEQKPTSWHYEDALNAVASSTKIPLHRTEGLLWTEIDNAEHLDRARNRVYPAIMKTQAIRESSKQPRRNILLTPGPATTSQSVKNALVQPDICPRGIEFGAVIEDTRSRLLPIVRADNRYESVLIPGSGTAAVEAALSSLISSDDKVLVIDNGAYGKRMAQIASAYRLNFLELELSPTLPIDLELITETLKRDSAISVVAWVHHETTTGLLNPLGELAKICQQFGLRSIVDTISSFAGVEIDLNEFEIDCLIGSANKCLQGMPGLAFAICDKDWLRESSTICRTLYLNLHQNWQSQLGGQFSFTPPVQVLYALQQAISELEKETLPARIDRYQSCNALIIDGMTELGFRTLVSPKWHSKLLTAFHLVDEFSFLEYYDFLLNHRIEIYPGKLDNIPSFRIANIGDIQPIDIRRFLDLTREFISKGSNER